MNIIQIAIDDRFVLCRGIYVFVCILVFSYHFTSISSQYFAYETKVDLKTETPDYMKLPGFTFCVHAQHVLLLENDKVKHDIINNAELSGNNRQNIANLFSNASIRQIYKLSNGESTGEGSMALEVFLSY